MTNPKPVALITGASGALGSAVASSLVARGWDVVSLSRSNPTAVGVAHYVGDCTDEATVRAAVAHCIERYGRIDACVHAASAPLAREHVLAASPAVVATQLRVTLHGALVLAQAVVPHLPSDGAFIGITTEALEQEPVPPRLGAYLCAKYALRGFLRVLAAELAGKGIRVYAAAPGFLPGGLNRDLPHALLSSMAAKQGAASFAETGAAIAELCVMGTHAPASGSSVRVPSGVVTPL